MAKLASDLLPGTGAGTAELLNVVPGELTRKNLIMPEQEHRTEGNAKGRNL